MKLCSKRKFSCLQPLHPYKTGFTLLEILIVVLIIGIMISFAALLFGGFFKSRKIENAAKEFSILLPLASQQAILQPAIIGLKINSHKYEFYLYIKNVDNHTGTWKLITKEDPILTPHSLPEKVEMELENNKKKDQPQIVFLPSGDNTPFTIIFSHEGKAPFYKITGNSQGGFTAVP